MSARGWKLDKYTIRAYAFLVRREQRGWGWAEIEVGLPVLQTAMRGWDQSIYERFWTFHTTPSPPC